MAKPTKRVTKQSKKVPIAVLRTLEKALAREGAEQQCYLLVRELGSLGEAGEAAAAAALLGHTKKGTVLARALLATLADGRSSDPIVRHCAGLQRGRKLMREAFDRVWRKAEDMAALDGAYRVFGELYLDDPALLAAGVEAARRGGDASALAERSARLDQATRLAPLIGELAGTAPERKRARAAFDALAPADRAHVYRRVLASPHAVDEEIAIEAARALVDDASVPALPVVSALRDMRYHGKNALVAGWQARTGGGSAEPALIARLIELCDLEAKLATDDDELEPYVQALWPAGARPEVFALAERLLASPNAAAREVVCEEWLREEQGRKAFTDVQIDRLIRMVVAICERGGEGHDWHAARRALFYCGHPGARHALIDAIRNGDTARDDELRRNAYNGLQRIRLPDVAAFYIERLFTEREAYWSLLDTFAARLDRATHDAVLAALRARAGDADAIHAATAYADLFAEKKSMPRFLVELGHTVLGWEASSEQDQRRLRHVFEEATLAALAIRSPDDARAFVARANALPAPYSDYQEVDRDNKTPKRFTDAAVKKQLAELAAGELDAAIAAARAKAAAARAAGKPVAVTDAQLGALAGCTVKWRLLDDRERKVVWFYDEADELHVYDGYEAIAPAAAGFTATDIGWRDETARLLDGRAEIAERVIAMDAKCAKAREVLRLGAVILVFTGAGQNYWEKLPVDGVGLVFGSEAAARDAFTRLAANLPEGTTRVDPWYVPGRGAVRRTYYLPLPGGGYTSDGDASVVVLGASVLARLDDPIPRLSATHADAGAAIAAVEAWEGALYAAGARLKELSIDRDATRREDTVLAAFLEERYRTDDRDGVWHARACTEMMAAIDEAGLSPLVPDIVVTAGPPATDAEIAAYQAQIPEPLPASLVAVWREVGGFGFTTGTTHARFLAPAELVARREALREQLRVWATQRLKGAKRAAMLAALPHYDVIATVDDAPVTIFDTTQAQEDGRCFGGPDSGWWESSLGWIIATDLAVVLKEALERRLGDIYRLRLGQRASDTTRRVRLRLGDKEYEAICDGAQTLTRTLTASSPGKPIVKTHATAAAATKFFDAAVAAQKKKGWKPLRV